MQFTFINKMTIQTLKDVNFSPSSYIDQCSQYWYQATALLS